MKYIILTKEKQRKIAIIQFNRPEALNALCYELGQELVATLNELEHDNDVNAVVLTGSDKAFAAGADIKEFCEQEGIAALNAEPVDDWLKVQTFKKPLIAAVSGFALGGGAEIMMCCDIIIASETTKIGQPEINIGIIPGGGGTQRFTRLVGKYRSMEINLTGDFIDANEAHRIGLINKIYPITTYLEEAKKLAEKIASKSPLMTRMIKDCILKAQELPLREGLDYERRTFYMLFSSADKKEGMRAFIEKRKPTWTGE